MPTLEQIDSNFKIDTSIEKEDIQFYDVRQAPFCVHGLLYEDGQFCRLPKCVSESVNDNVVSLGNTPAGGRVRFKTDSPYVAIHAVMPMVGGKESSHFTFVSAAGFDLYVRVDRKDRLVRPFMPPTGITTGYESVIDLGTSDLREITIYFPRSSHVGQLYIGLSNTAKVFEPEPYTIKKPIVFYGSSITQGYCASRSGSDYVSMVSRRLDADYINLGLSGNAKAEPELAEYIKTLDMSAFVFDYDHNAPDCQYFQETHEPFFSIIRKAHPELPILMMGRPVYYLNEAGKQRLEIIRTTYQHALDRGDRNVYILDGPTLMAFAKDDGSVDGCHPTDLGFFSMAQAVGDVLENILKKR